MRSEQRHSCLIFSLRSNIVSLVAKYQIGVARGVGGREGGGGKPRHAKLVLFVTLGRQPNQELDLHHKVGGFS